MGIMFIIVVCILSFVIIGYIGDSCCYMVLEGEMMLVMEDYLFVNEFVKYGEILKEDVEYYLKKNVLLRVLGIEEKVGLDVKMLVIEEDD